MERGERTVDLPFLDEVAAAMRAPHAQRAFLHRHLRHTGGEDGAAAAAALAEAAKSIDRVAVSQLFQGLARAASRLQPHVLVVAREAKAAGLRVGILTNDFTASPAWLDEWASPADRRALQASQDALVDCASCKSAVVRSSSAACRKPEPAAYRLACRRLGVSPSAESGCLFVDDLRPNIEAAGALGLNTLRVRLRDTPHETARRIRAALALALPTAPPAPHPHGGRLVSLL